MSKKGTETIPKEFRCAATGKALYLPVITTEGVAYSFAALFEMFATAEGGLPICKATQEPIRFFPGVCQPLHLFMMSEFRTSMRGRKQQDEADMFEKFGLGMPALPDTPEDESDDGWMELFTCPVSDELVYEPCGLSSGSMVSAYCVPEKGFKKDPDRLIACSLHFQAPKKCLALEAMVKTKFPKEYGQRANDLAKQGIQATGEHATGSYAQFPQDEYIHWGLGCEGCGIWPIVGKAWYDADCPDKVGFHLCDQCYTFGYHRRVITGRFNQNHMPKNTMKEVQQNDFM
uniref:ZZ-type domain-containing protein n=1 Tax=Alexandrium andersonii TaxID=327968 RepID=A0A7S2HHZ9_9DINO